MRLILIALLVMGCAAPTAAQERATHIEQRFRDDACPTPRRTEASARLEQLRAEDEADRAGAVSADTSVRDLARRREVTSLFSEGCFSTGRDYHNAALVFQHGPVPEHHYQAWLFARRAVELGDAEAQWLIPRAIDRYLMNSGYKQLFATNLVTDHFYSSAAEGAGTWCVWPTVDSLDDAQRTAIGGSALEAQIDRAQQMNNGTGGGVCDLALPDPPRELFPGVW